MHCQHTGELKNLRIMKYKFKPKTSQLEIDYAVNDGIFTYLSAVLSCAFSIDWNIRLKLHILYTFSSSDVKEADVSKATSAKGTSRISICVVLFLSVLVL